MWRLLYNREASNYALDSYPYNEDVLVEIETLALTAEGLPANNYARLDSEYYVWEIAKHTVIFQRIVDKMEIRILVIKPSL
jgi:hypothetical protein